MEPGPSFDSAISRRLGPPPTAPTTAFRLQSDERAPQKDERAPQKSKFSLDERAPHRDLCLAHSASSPEICRPSCEARLPRWSLRGFAYLKELFLLTTPLPHPFTLPELQASHRCAFWHSTKRNPAAKRKDQLVHVLQKIHFPSFSSEVSSYEPVFVQKRVCLRGYGLPGSGHEWERGGGARERKAAARTVHLGKGTLREGGG